jgi:hypothetical protein
MTHEMEEWKGGSMEGWKIKLRTRSWSGELFHRFRGAEGPDVLQALIKLC